MIRYLTQGGGKSETLGIVKCIYVERVNKFSFFFLSFFLSFFRMFSYKWGEGFRKTSVTSYLYSPRDICISLKRGKLLTQTYHRIQKNS